MEKIKVHSDSGLLGEDDPNLRWRGGNDSFRIEKFDLKTKCHCLNCEFEGTYEDLEYTQFNRGEPSCPYCGCDDIEETIEETGFVSSYDLLDVVIVPRGLLEELLDWLSQPQTTGGSFPMETHRAESEGMEHIYSEIVDALEGGE